ncbi:hypothetical protein F6Y24_16110 [Xanthomonas arboricola pv. pruni]|nr:hypothetical protein F6Y24_16110 [Xanthomonas arboricola pv. pruni]RST71696.1 hypothetical protein EJK96_06175 [Xanthomonas arboricola pv. pruni]RST78127.1 hypothetical protein EJL05_14075 [Xanthomonas arboricola pv. pruni]
MTNVSCKKRKARPARVHEGARFNQTFYPYACVLFSAGCAVRQACCADRIQRSRRHPTRRGQACVPGMGSTVTDAAERSASACVRSRLSLRDGAAQDVRRG